MIINESGRVTVSAENEEQNIKIEKDFNYETHFHEENQMDLKPILETIKNPFSLITELMKTFEERDVKHAIIDEARDMMGIYQQTGNYSQEDVSRVEKEMKEIMKIINFS